MRDRDSFWQLKLFYFYLSVNCLSIYLFFCFVFFFCLICVDFFSFFLLYFTLFFFFLLILGDWAYRVICFVVYCYLFIFIYFFFYLHGFSGGGGCKFNCSWHFFTSSDRVLPGGVAQRLRFDYGYWRVVSYTNDDLGKRVGWLRRIDGYGTEETVDDGLGGRCLGAGRCPVAPPSGWSWLDDLVDGVNCFGFFFIFWRSMEIAGKVLAWWKVPCSTVTRLELRGQYLCVCMCVWVCVCSDDFN